MLSRYSSITRIVGDVDHFAVIAGLGSSVFDMVRMSDHADTVFPLDGVMGAAVSMGLGLALARPELSVLVVTGDGELLMNVGALATVAVQDPPNLSILCVDNGLYGLTGGQATHTAHGTDIAAMAAGAGLRSTLTCAAEQDLERASQVLHSRQHASLVVLKVGGEPSAPCRVDRNANACRTRFLAAVSPKEAQQ